MLWGLSVAAGLASVYAMWVFARSWQRARALARAALEGQHPGSRLPKWLEAPLRQSRARDLTHRVEAVGQLVTEVDYRLRGALSPAALLRVPMAAMLSVSVLAWWSDRIVAWVALGAGVCATVACWGFYRAGRRHVEEARRRFALLIRGLERSLPQDDPSGEPIARRSSKR